MLQLLEVKKKQSQYSCVSVRLFLIHYTSSPRKQVIFFGIFCVVKPLHAMSVIAGPMLSATTTQLQSWGLEGPPAVVLGN